MHLEQRSEEKVKSRATLKAENDESINTTLRSPRASLLLHFHRSSHLPSNQILEDEIINHVRANEDEVGHRCDSDDNGKSDDKENSKKQEHNQHSKE